MRVGRTTYTYDNTGRVIRTVTKRLSRKPLVHEFFYATNEQPIGFFSSDNKQVGWRYIYDSYGRRVAKEAINTTTGEVTHRTVFTHIGNQLVAETVTDTTKNSSVTTAHGGGHPENNLDDVETVEQALVDAQFFTLVTHLAGSPQDIINPTTGDIAGLARHSLYSTRTWTGKQTSPLLFAGQNMDAQSG